MQRGVCQAVKCGMQCTVVRVAMHYSKAAVCCGIYSLNAREIRKTLYTST